MIPGQAHLAALARAYPQREVSRFLCIFADTEEARQHHYALRYKVFCEETGFENPDAFPDRIERDRYDAHARHFLVWDRHEHQWAGAMRLVEASSTRLPSEEIVGAPLLGLDERRHRSVEFSRLCILSQYRRTNQSTFYGLYRTEGQYPRTACSVLYRQEDNEVLLQLLGASFGWRPEIEHCYFIVTPALARVLSRFGIPLRQVGGQVEHRGTRIPFQYDVREAEQGMRETLAGFASMTEGSRPFEKYSDFIDGNLDDEIAIRAVDSDCFTSGQRVAHVQ